MHPIITKRDLGDMIKLTGEVEIRVLDVDTLEVVNVIKQSNVITRAMYKNWITGSATSLMPQVYISTGGASLSREDGVLLFNSADADKTISGTYVASYQVTTPCNNPPV